MVKSPGFFSSDHAVLRPAMLVLAAMAMLAYWPALQGEFVNWDDPMYVTDNTVIRDFGLRSLVRIFTEPMVANYHPLTLVSHALDYAVWGMNPLGHHLTSVLLHGLNTALVFLLLVRLFPPSPAPSEPASWRTSPSLWAAGAAALLFGLHPIHVESVAWISERKDVLYSVFYLLSLLVYVRYARMGAGEWGRRRLYAACLGLFALSLLSKPMAVTLPGVLLLLDVYPLRRFAQARPEEDERLADVLLEKLPFVLLALALVFMTLMAQEMAMKPVPLAHRPVGALHAMIFYLQKLVWPSDLAPFYPRELIFGFVREPWRVILYAALFLGVTAYGLIRIRRRPEWFVAWGTYVIQLLPVVGLVHVGTQVAADRYAYLPSVPVFYLGCRMVSSFFVQPSRWRRPAGAVVFVLLVGLLFRATWVQAGLWKDSVTLWSHEIRLFPDLATAYFSRGQAYQGREAYVEALVDYDRAIELDPGFALAYANRGVVRMKLGQTDGALEDYARAIDRNPRDRETHGNRGWLFLELGRDAEALLDFTKVIEIDPTDSNAHYGRGRVYLRQGDYPRAIEDFTDAIARDPANPEAYNSRGIAYDLAGQPERSLEDFGRAIELAPGSSEALVNRSLVYQRMGRYPEAAADLEKALRLSPTDAELHARLRSVYSALGQSERAAKHLDEAERLHRQGDRAAGP